MDYQALYRKYRPKTFNDVAGQNVTLKILKNAIKNQKIAHAYLFYGPRGTGKTSIAKIFARTINCDYSEIEQIPCEKCDKCRSSIERECVDILEIDAASNNGVDEIRELKNKISFVPSILKYKVYIIDEVHMLSTGAFNALLKTLEEPPAHAIFILATTELNKVPTTIISRCQTLEFNKINNKDMEEKLKEIAINEKIEIDDYAINEIVRYSNGGLRDAIGILEKSSSYNSGLITMNTIKEVSGNITEEELELFIKLYEEKKLKEIIEKIDEYYQSGVDLIKLINTLIEYFGEKLIKTSNFEMKKCRVIKELDSIVEELKKTDNPKILLEISLMNLLVEDNKEEQGLNLEQEKKINIKTNEISNNTESFVDSVEEDKKILNANINNNDGLKKIRVSNTLAEAQKNIILEIRNNWNKLKELAFDKNYGNISRLLSSDIIPVAASNSHVVLTSKLGGLSEQINNDIYNVEKIFEKIFSNKYKVICISENEWNEYITLYKKDKTLFKVVDESDIIEQQPKERMSLKEKAKALFEDL